MNFRRLQKLFSLSILFHNLKEYFLFLHKRKTTVMKQVLFLFVIGFLAACNAGDNATVKSETATDSTAKNTEPAYAYTPSYTSKFEIGDPAHSKAILDLAKDWDNNSLDHSKQLFADSVTLYTADGTVMSGPADSIIAASKPYRNSLGTVSSTVHAWTPLKATDKNENWVLLWYTEYTTAANGKKDSTEYQETWRLNKQGKADLLMQYMRKNPPAKK
jgi:hypothetical protein